MYQAWRPWLIKNAEVKKIFVESASRVARSAKVAEEIYETAKSTGTEIIVANNPALFKLDATPEQNFFRGIAFAVAEYERDLLVDRLQSGLRAAAAKRGGMSVQGRKSILDKTSPTKKQKKVLKALIAQRVRVLRIAKYLARSHDIIYQILRISKYLPHSCDTIRQVLRIAKYFTCSRDFRYFA